MLKKVSSNGGSSESLSSDSGSEEKTSINNYNNAFEYFGWVYHLGVNSIGHQYCHLRYLFIRGKYVEMYKRDPHENPGTKPIRRGVVGQTLMVEEFGKRRVNNGDFYVLRFSNRLDETRKGEIACATVGEAKKWIEAFDEAKQQAEYELTRGGSTRSKLNTEAEINLDGHRPRVRRYAHGLKKLIRIGQGPEMLLRQSSTLGNSGRSEIFFDADGGDVVEPHQWKCVRTVNGVRLLEDVASSQSGKAVLVKAVAVVNASADTVFDVIFSLDRLKRYEWDPVTADLELIDSINGHFDVVYGIFDPRYFSWYVNEPPVKFDLELIDSINGHFDVVYGIFDPRYFSWWKSKRDFLFSRQWFRGQDGTYTILQNPTVNKKWPPKSGYQRIKINPSTWEIRNLYTSSKSGAAKCLVTQMLELHAKGWFKWKSDFSPKFERTIPFALLSQVAGLKEYVEANPAFSLVSPTTVVQSKISDLSTSSELLDVETADEFYDAIAGDSSSDDEDSDNDSEAKNKNRKVKLKNVSWAIASLALKRTSAEDANKKELNLNVAPIDLDPSQFHGSMQQGKNEVDNNCWTSPSGTGFMIRGKTYLKDSTKVKGGEPLLKLIAVDWFKMDQCLGKIALNPKSLVQTEAGKKIPFILVINLQVPAKPNYSLVLYYAADRPVNKNSLLGKFIDGTDMYRDARFKLIPSIAEGYWMVKRAVGTKACLLGKAVTCNYLRQDNFLEIDVDIGSSSVARSVISLVLGYVTSLVVDLAIVIEAKEESELPEYILGTVRLNRVRPDAAVSLDA